jgi:hypothetical protein
LIARHFPHQPNIAEFAANRLLRALLGFATLHAIACGHLQMCLQFLLELLLPEFSSPES